MSETAKTPKIVDNLVENITTFKRNRPDKVQAEQLLDNILPPENCSGLEPVLVNEAVWQRMLHDAKTADLKCSKL